MKRTLLALAVGLSALAAPALASAHPYHAQSRVFIDGPDWDRRADLLIQRGHYLHRDYYGPSHWVHDYRHWGVRAPRRGYEWVQIGPRQLALVNLRNGYVVDVVKIRRW